MSDHVLPHGRQRDTTLGDRVCIAFIVLLVTVLALLITRIILYRPENHWGYDIRQLHLFPLCAGLWTCWAFVKRAASVRLLVIVGVAAIAFALAIQFMDHLNLIVEYGRWTKRGMPLQWQRAWRAACTI